MVAHITTIAFQGIETLPVDVQVQLSNGLPSFTIVGLPDKTVAESRERVRAALAAIGLALPAQRITINLSPADLQKEGSHYDLPIALGLMKAMEALPFDAADNYIVLGELSLDAQLAPISGVLPAAMAALEADQGLICPEACGSEAVWAGEIDIIAATDLMSLINHFKGRCTLPRPNKKLAEFVSQKPDFSEVKGQNAAKRAFEIAAAGGHNLLMIGPPGSGKSMLAARMPGLLPPLHPAEALELSMIYSVSGLLSETGLPQIAPFRDPHHTISAPALIGGGRKAHPGEISLAHNGVLFLDEFPEFNRQTLEALRQPLESGKAVIARANAHVTYPARFQLIAAMNPCRCGDVDDTLAVCARGPRCAIEYQARISGPLLDRIDLHVDVNAVKPFDLANSKEKEYEKSTTIAKRVSIARQRQIKRFHKKSGAAAIRINAHADGALLEEIASPDSEGRTLLVKAADKMRLTARGYHRILRVARTIADLEGVEHIKKPHIAEALSYRRIRPAL